MAMRQRTGGITPIRPRAAVRPVYEDFMPMSEWKQEEESDIVLVYLPGFLREQIKVTTERENVLRVRGEQLVVGNKWRRFQEDFPIPENCNIRGIRAKFEGGILTVTMPKKSIPQLGSRSRAKTTQEAPSPHDAAGKPKSEKVQEDIRTKADLSADTAKQGDGKSLRPPSPQRATIEPKPQKVQDDTPPKVTQTDGKSLAAPSPQKVASKPKSQKVQDETPLNATSSTGTQKQTDGTAENIVPETMERKEMSETKGKPAESKIPEKAKEKSSDGTAGTSGEKAKDYSNATKAKQTTDVTAGGGYKLENYKQAVKGLAKVLKEERQLVVNMGVAVLVLVAFGAYISYSFGSSGKAKN